MGAGKIIVIIGAIVGVLSVLLGLFLPELFCWYRLDVIGGTYSVYLTGFGTTIAGPSPSDQIAMLVLIGGILVLIGSIACVVGGIKEMKIVGIIGGILMILGPLLLIADILTVMSDFMEYMEAYTGESGIGLIWDRDSPVMGVTVYWGLWIGSFLALGGGILGIIGGVAT